MSFYDRDQTYTNDKGKKYQCFVCGRLYEEFAEFKEHIKEDHEEGREYVLCPLQRCGAPVRDLRMHFKVKHPSEDFNKVSGPERAMIWKDFSPRGKGKNKVRKIRKGKHYSTKMQKYFTYRSGWEKQVYELLDQDTDVSSYEAEPFQIPYVHQGTAHQYTPDIFISFMDDRKEVWEIKPANQTLLERNKNKWHYAENACKARGWGWQVVTEKVIDKLCVKIRNQKIQLGD